MKRGKGAPAPKRKRSPKSKPAGLQWSLDDELAHLEELIEKRARQVIKKPQAHVDSSPAAAEVIEKLVKIGLMVVYIYISLQDKDIDRDPTTTPHQEASVQNCPKLLITFPSGTRPCLYDDPATRETIRRQLLDIGVTNVNQLIRTRTAAELIEAISDLERAESSGRRIKNPAGYLMDLLK